MDIFSIKKYLFSRRYRIGLKLLLLGMLSCGTSQNSHAAMRILKACRPVSYPYRPVWDFLLSVKKFGMKPVVTKLLQPPVVYSAAPAVIATGVWAYCSWELWQLERRKNEVGHQWYTSLKDTALDPTTTFTNEQTTAAAPYRSVWEDVEKREWPLWLTKWASFGIGSLCFMLTYKHWEK